MTKRGNMPSRRQIAEWWAKNWRAESRESFAGELSDLGEPFCWACSAYFAEFKDPCPRWGKPEAYDLAVELERCHLVSSAVGGSSEPSNLVLLCHDCHQEMDRELGKGANRSRAAALQWVCGYRGRWARSLHDQLDEQTIGRLSEISPLEWLADLRDMKFSRRSTVATAAALREVVEAREER
jgi:hypothetical protein